MFSGLGFPVPMQRENRIVQQLSFWTVAISLRAVAQSYSDFAPFQEALGVLGVSYTHNRFGEYFFPVWEEPFPFQGLGGTKIPKLSFLLGSENGLGTGLYNRDEA
jgi:hypothetical protein